MKIGKIPLWGHISPQIGCVPIFVLRVMEYIVKTEKELVEALKKCKVQDCIWMKPDLLNAHRSYIKSFAKNRKLNIQECLWNGKGVYQLTFY